MGMENGFSSPRSEAFPAGLRVLVVDDDPTWLKILEKMLKKCSYEVTTCGLAREALKLLRDRKDGFDIVISDVNMPDMDGFKLLEYVGLEMDLPVIMMSVDGETSRVMKGVQHGACDYLLKPIRMKELKNIWQHVLRKKMNEVKDIECIDDRTDPSHDAHYGYDQTILKKRKDVGKHDEKDFSDSSSTKKSRVVWTVELHQKFVKAVNQLGIDSDKIGPKKILDLMNVPWLTRENVASHLQKYRLYLSRIRKEDRIESSYGGMKNQDHSPKESSGSFTLQNSSFGQQHDITSTYFHQGIQLPVRIVDSKPMDNKSESSKLSSLTEPRIPFNTENSDSRTSRNPEVGLSHNYEPLDISIKDASFDSPVAGRYPWSGEVPDLQFEPEFKPHPKLEDCFNQPAAPILHHHVGPDILQPGPSIMESNNIGLMGIKSLNAKKGGNNIVELPPMKTALGTFSVSNTDAFECVIDMKSQNFSPAVNTIKEPSLLQRSFQSFPVPSESHLVHSQGLNPCFNVAQEVKKQGSCLSSITGQNSVIGSESEIRNQVSVLESPSGLIDENLMFHWLQCGDCTSKDFEFDCVGLSGCNFLEHDYGSLLPPYAPKLEYEYPFDWVEYPPDQGNGMQVNIVITPMPLKRLYCLWRGRKFSGHDSQDQ